MIYPSPIIDPQFQISECQSNRSTEKKFQLKNASLIVPNLLKDLLIRRYLVYEPIHPGGMDLVSAYQHAMYSEYIPTVDLQPCIDEVMRTPGVYEFQSNTLSFIGGFNTCKGFKRCFEELVGAGYPDPDPDPRKRRMMIGRYVNGTKSAGIFTPSPQESDCIKAQFDKSRDISQAYNSCGARDIFPAFPGAAEGIASRLTIRPDFPMYRIVKDTMIESIPSQTTTTATPLETIPISPATSPESEKQGNYLVYIIGLAVLLVLLKK